MATQFTSAEWDLINERLQADPEWYGLPQKEYGSVLLGSFNVRSWGRLEAVVPTRGSSLPTSAVASTCWQSKRSWTTSAGCGV